ncbi:hypothetical protein EVAR_41508_1 [Eumeta japonica]|uniref:Uncharacterized protein n=1 Tax=Eumeta variegata TaxID=151549 RepID=A0A4C1X650_EUMVA|nr:hypothetical protein EVAR_41508_1 [Eumeta japonica]
MPIRKLHLVIDSFVQLQHYGANPAVRARRTATKKATNRLNGRRWTTVMRVPAADRRASRGDEWPKRERRVSWPLWWTNGYGRYTHRGEGADLGPPKPPCSPLFPNRPFTTLARLSWLLIWPREHYWAVTSTISIPSSSNYRPSCGSMFHGASGTSACRSAARTRLRLSSLKPEAFRSTCQRAARSRPRFSYAFSYCTSRRFNTFCTNKR